MRLNTHLEQTQIKKLQDDETKATKNLQDLRAGPRATTPARLEEDAALGNRIMVELVENQVTASRRECRGHEEQVRLDIHGEPRGPRPKTLPTHAPSTLDSKTPALGNRIMMEFLEELNQVTASRDCRGHGECRRRDEARAYIKTKARKTTPTNCNPVIWSRPKSRNCKQTRPRPGRPGPRDRGQEQVRLNIHGERRGPRPKTLPTHPPSTSESKTLGGSLPPWVTASWWSSWRS